MAGLPQDSFCDPAGAKKGAGKLGEPAECNQKCGWTGIKWGENAKPWNPTDEGETPSLGGKFNEREKPNKKGRGGEKRRKNSNSTGN